MVMLTMVALLAGSSGRERWAAFLWAFAIWDLSYYAGLWATIRWPTSLLDLDVLFLIPVPWIAQVWFPLLVSLMTILAIAWSCRGGAISLTWWLGLSGLDVLRLPNSVHWQWSGHARKEVALSLWGGLPLQYRASRLEVR